MEEII